MNTNASPAIAGSLDTCLASDTGRTFTRTYPGLLSSADERRRVRAAWKAFVAKPRLAFESRGPSTRDIAVYSLLMGKPLNRAFSPVTNVVKLANGQRPFGALLSALLALDSVNYRNVHLQNFLIELQVDRDESGHFPVLARLLQAAAAVNEHALGQVLAAR